MTKDSIVQRCRGPLHEFGWLIHLLITLVTIAYFAGGLNSTVNSLVAKTEKMESAILQLQLQMGAKK